MSSYLCMSYHHHIDSKNPELFKSYTMMLGEMRRFGLQEDYDILLSRSTGSLRCNIVEYVETNCKNGDPILHNRPHELSYRMKLIIIINMQLGIMLTTRWSCSI